MSSPENIFHRSHVFFAPEDKTGDVRGLKPQENTFETNQETVQTLGLAVQSIVRGRKRIDLPTEEIATEYLNGTVVTEMAQRYNVSTRTIYRRLHEAGLPRHTQDINSESTEFVEKQFWWRRDLSQNGQNLYEILIGEGRDKAILSEIATTEGWDLNEALNELRAFNILEESDPDIISFIQRKS